MPLERAVFAAGCFWGVQAAFDEMAGVVSTRVGYAGGHTGEPTYDQVCSGQTGHAEALEVAFETDSVSYQQLLEKFFALHDPTQLNRQGPDVGTQYRSAIFVSTAQQRESAKAFLTDLKNSRRFTRPVVTTIEELTTFWPAEDYHQKYLERRGLTSCHTR